MDQDALVGGSEGLRAIAQAFRASTAFDFPVQAIYFIERTTLYDESDWNVAVVMSPFRPGVDANLLSEFARLQWAGKLPFVDDSVRVMAVSPDSIEASRLLAFSRRRGPPPTVLRNVITEGLSIKYALVAEDRGYRAEAA